MTTIALALGAGGARGFAHVHAIQAFNDLGVKPTSVAGTSIGSIIGREPVQACLQPRSQITSTVRSANQ
jgi:hypothetical protein